MLETVLKIGKAFRESPTGLRHHRYVKLCPQDTDKRKTLRLSLPVKEDFGFDFNGIKEIRNENVIRDKLYYPTFKTSDADGKVKYIFGDIYYTLLKGDEGGYYRLGDKTKKQKDLQKSSFLRGIEDFKSLEKIYEGHLIERRLSEVDISEQKSFMLTIFRGEFEKNIAFIERLLKYQCGISEYLEFNSNGKATEFMDLLSNENELKRLTAKRVFSNIKQARGAKKTFKSVIDIDEPQWSLIETKGELIEKLVAYSTGDIFLHFDFSGKHWYEFTEEFNAINSKILEDFAESSNRTKGVILKKSLYKTLSSAEKDLQFPSFHAEARYRNKLFRNIEEILDLLYAIDYSKTALLKVLYTDIKIIVLPKGKNISASHYEKFIQQANSLQSEQEGETIIGQENMQDSNEQLFAPLIENVAEDIIQFDLIFSKKGGQTAPDVDLVELCGIEKSHLREIGKHICEIKRTLYDKRQSEIKAELKPLSITWSFLNILRDSTADIKKYQSHLYKVLPQIYTGTYYNDPILLPALIEKTEANIRADETNFNLLKYDFYFLTSIQNTLPEGGNLMKIQESQSYRIGLLLGELARQFAAWREDCPIKSFEKSYVGTLSRRITTIPDLIRFKTFMEEKLILHERSSFTHPVSTKLSEEIKTLEASSKEKYDRHNCAFGFFESYFAPGAAKKDNPPTVNEINQ